MARHCDVVAFDVFDTLLCRHVAPDDVKETCARELATRIGNPDASARLYELRRKLEAGMCQEATRAGLDYEFRHDELMRRWAHAASPLEDTLGAELAAHELACERLVTAPTPSAAAAIAAARAAGARAVWISDNYLPAAAIDGLLAVHGLRAWLQGGYASSTDLHTKRSGRLFIDLLQTECIEPGRLLVVGDDRHADRDAAHRVGAHTIWIRDVAALARRARLHAAHALVRRHRFFAGHRWATAASFGVRRRRSSSAPGSAHRELGRMLGTTFSAFALFVHEQARDLGLDRVFFLSREGATLLHLYRRVGRVLAEPSPPAAYFCASRRSTFLPSLARLDVETLAARLWTRHPHQSPLQILTDLSLPSELGEVALAHGLGDPSASLSAPASDPRVAAFLADPRIQEAFVEARARARAGLRRYWSERGGAARGAFGVVDVGWHGSIQNNLWGVLTAATDGLPIGDLTLDGLYLAFVDDAEEAPGNRKRGYLIDHQRGDGGAKALLQNSQVFEMFASAPHGAVVGYEEARGRIRPRLCPETHVDRGLWHAVRHGMREAVDDCLPALAWLRPRADDLRAWLLDRIHRYVHYPTLAEARAILQYGHGESFGGSPSTRYEFAGSWRHILFGGAPWHIAARAVAAFAQQEWPGAALRRSHVPGLCYLYDRYRSLPGT
ncbi:MAG: hypothetical protein R3F56_24970 [Planctomycetota bacterium]